MRILLVDNDADTHARIYVIARAEGYRLCHERLANVGDHALHQGLDAIIVGSEPPLHDGLQRCRRWREANFSKPVFVLSSDPDPAVRTRSYEAGADAFLPRQFDTREFVVRLRGLLPGALGARPSVFRIDDLVMDLQRRTVVRAGQPIALTHQEFALLEQLIRVPGEVLSQSDLGERVWDIDHCDVSKLVKAYVWRLRQKIDKRFHPKLIRTIRGVGYALTVTRD